MLCYRQMAIVYRRLLLLCSPRPYALHAVGGRAGTYSEFPRDMVLENNLVFALWMLLVCAYRNMIASLYMF